MIILKKEEQTPPEEHEEKDIDRTPTRERGEGIDRLQDMRDLRVLLGFHGADWDGMGREAEYLYQWSRTDSEGAEAVYKVKSLIRQLGLQSTGKDLLRKLSEYARLDLQKQEIEKRQANL